MKKCASGVFRPEAQLDDYDTCQSALVAVAVKTFSFSDSSRCYTLQEKETLERRKPPLPPAPFVTSWIATLSCAAIVLMLARQANSPPNTPEKPCNMCKDEPEESAEVGGSTTLLGHSARTLTPDEMRSLGEDRELVSEFKQVKLEQEAKKHWDKFYLRNEARFFKDRHWTTREFEELLMEPHSEQLRPASSGDDRKPILLEVGCGVGNMVLPLLEDNTPFQVIACDFSPRAVALLSANPTFIAKGGRAFVCDLTTTDAFLNELPPASVDVVTMIFMLSAVHPDKMPTVLNNIYKVLRPGGVVLFRDYGLYDQAQLRFKKGHKLQENFYVRQDGTRAYYFSEEVIRLLFEKEGFSTKVNSYVKRATVNRKEGIDVPRVFLQAKFVKPCEQNRPPSMSDESDKL